jgi:hypothetical protein
VQDHAVVLEAEPPRQLGELEVASGGAAAGAREGELLVEQVHLPHVARVEGQVLPNLLVGDPLEPAEPVERLLRVHAAMLGSAMPVSSSRSIEMKAR